VVAHPIFRRFAFALPSFAAVLAIGALALSQIERARNAEEEYAVYSAYLSEGIRNDPHDWSVGPPIQVVIEDKTSVGGSLRWPMLFIFDKRVRFEQMMVTTRASFVVRNLLRTRLQDKIRLPSRATPILASVSEIGSSGIQQKFSHTMGYIVLSGVGFNSNHTQAVFYMDHFCGLCGGGRYVLMEKVKGIWEVRGEHYHLDILNLRRRRQ
jgi:hypothetical protein